MPRTGHKAARFALVQPGDDGPLWMASLFDIRRGHNSRAESLAGNGPLDIA
jgi:hypothetical protein